jgi:hypothetical protein
VLFLHIREEFDLVCRECFDESFAGMLTSMEMMHSALPETVTMAKLIPQINNQTKTRLPTEVVSRLLPVEAVTSFCNSIYFDS